MADRSDRVDAYVAGPSLWSAYEHHEEVGSTNDLALQRVREGGPAGLVVVADRQTAGRGRAGRAWEDVAGGSLLLSVATGVPAAGVTLVPLAVGLAVSDAMRRHGVRADLKWPNDVVVDGRKCAGILVESHDLGPDGPRCLVIGVGVDVDWRGVERSGEAEGWTSVAEVTGGDVDRDAFTIDLLRALEAWLLDVPDDPTRLLAAYRVRCTTLGQQVRVRTVRAEAVGTAVDVDGTGALVLDTAEGRRTVVAGDVELLRPA